MRKKAFDFKNEELIPVSDLALQSYTNDRAEFIALLPDYDGEHLQNAINMRDMIDKLINPGTLTSRAKNSTQALYTALKETLDFADKFERFAEKAAEAFPVSKSDLELSDMRKKCHSRDSEGVVKILKNISQFVEPYKAVLEAKGFTPEWQAKLAGLIKTIGDIKKQRTGITNQRAKLVQDNINDVNAFWKVIEDILKTGKTIYKENPAKKKEYTKSEILKKVRRNIKDNGEGGGNGEASK